MKNLIAYMDESGHSAHPNCKFVGMGGLVAKSSSWDQLNLTWRDALIGAGVRGSFHMKDFAYRSGEFSGWGETQRRTLYSKLVDAIVQAAAIPVGCVISLVDLSNANPVLQRFYGDPYYMAFQFTTRGASLQGVPNKFPPVVEPVDMVFALQPEFGATQAQPEFERSGRAQKLWSAMKEKTVYGQWMGTYTCASPKDSCPLQAADLFAYELTKEFENLMNRPDDEMRWALRQLLPLGGNRPLIQFFDLYELVRLYVEANQDAPSTGDASASIITESFFRKLALRDLLIERSKVRND